MYIYLIFVTVLMCTINMYYTGVCIYISKSSSSKEKWNQKLVNEMKKRSQVARTVSNK